MEKLNLEGLAKKTSDAQEKISSGQKELKESRKIFEDNQNVLMHEGHLDYISKLQDDLKNATDVGDKELAFKLVEEIHSRKKDLEEKKIDRSEIKKVLDKKGTEDYGGGKRNATRESSLESFKIYKGHVFALVDNVLDSHNRAGIPKRYSSFKVLNPDMKEIFSERARSDYSESSSLGEKKNYPWMEFYEIEEIKDNLVKIKCRDGGIVTIEFPKEVIKEFKNKSN